ncbi:hypothetical protein NQ317_015369 [Molorchus minor]|uniref:Sushi domain-containing protein n=1 Tax=Molorchus minor TaxID=1323400 RepID=A0ABQ9JCT2_9CUCU|nr:hypothetical protein NQ317_015369 [Molorchus minor]
MCSTIQCKPPVLPVNGHLIQSEAPGMDGGRYAVGSLVQFACHGAHHLEGEASKPRCSYVGEPKDGFITPTKFAYDPGDELEIVCNPGFEAMLVERPKCLPDGKWSSPIPNCTNYTKI